MLLTFGCTTHLVEFSNECLCILLSVWLEHHAHDCSHEFLVPVTFRCADRNPRPHAGIAPSASALLGQSVELFSLELRDDGRLDLIRRSPSRTALEVERDPGSLEKASVLSTSFEGREFVLHGELTSGDVTSDRPVAETVSRSLLLPILDSGSTLPAP